MEITDYVNRSNHILVTTHISPDGDGIGSCMALGAALRKLGKKTTVALSDPIPIIFHYFPGWQEVRGPDADLTGVDLIFVLDLSDIGRLGDLYDDALFKRVPIINVDHHPTNTQFGTINVVFPDAAATCELIRPLIRSLGVEIDKDMAICLLTGLVTDTLGFRTTSTSASALRLAADFVEHGVSLASVTDAVFDSKAFSAIKLMGLALAQMQLRGRIVWTSLTRAMIVESGALPEEFEPIVNMLSRIREADIAIVFKELEDGTTRVSMRANDRVDAGKICQRFGGGGHQRAAGCGIPVGLQAAQQTFLSYVEDVVNSGD